MDFVQSKNQAERQSCNKSDNNLFPLLLYLLPQFVDVAGKINCCFTSILVDGHILDFNQSSNFVHTKPEFHEVSHNRQDFHNQEELLLERETECKLQRDKYKVVEHKKLYDAFVHLFVLAEAVLLLIGLLIVECFFFFEKAVNRFCLS